MWPVYALLSAATAIASPDPSRMREVGHGPRISGDSAPAHSRIDRERADDEHGMRILRTLGADPAPLD